MSSPQIPPTAPQPTSEHPSTAQTPTTQTPTRSTGPARIGLALVCLVLLAFNLRPAATSVSPVLAEVRTALALSPAMAGLLTSLPVLAFAVFGAMAPWFARVIGVHRVSLLALIAVVVGLGARAVTDSGPAFLLWTFLAVAGMACANVLAPSLVKLHFPDRIGFATACYTTAMATGLTLAFVATVPMAEALGTWRWGLGVWAVVALLAVMPWIALATRDRNPERGNTAITFRQVARTPLGWGLATFFGVQSTIAYSLFGWFAQMWRDTGYSAAYAGVLVGVIAAAGIPCSLVLPSLLARVPDQRVLLFGVIACYPVAFLGLLALPGQLGGLWALLLGIGGTTFPLILVLISMRARTAAGTAALSGFTQSVGYLIAVPGPMALGLIHEASDGWVAPIWFLFALLVPLVALAFYVGRPAHLEDQVRSR